LAYGHGLIQAESAFEMLGKLATFDYLPDSLCAIEVNVNEINAKIPSAESRRGIYLREWHQFGGGEEPKVCHFLIQVGPKFAKQKG
jgi:hypothetical protein